MSATIEQVVDLTPATLAAFDAVVDVRSPSEFAEDHLPGAINLPVLDDAERAEIGEIYVQTSRFLARRLGAAKVSRNIARHLETALADKPAAFRPLLYCWRGGMRSGAMATVLAQIGWRVGVVGGGYRTWRRAVVEGVRKSDAPLPVVLVDGQTGTAKTEILGRLAAEGAQTLDLEAMAEHRGSVFGADPGAVQPSQKLFESRLWRALQALDPSRPIAVEAESVRIGARVVPRRLWRSMLAAPRIEIVADAGSRARYLAERYAVVAQDAPFLCGLIERLRPFHPRETIDRWLDLAQSAAFEPLASDLLTTHYDPLYDRARARRLDAPLARVRLDVLSPQSQDSTAREIAVLLATRVRQK